jgi:hypothetical protein
MIEIERDFVTREISTEAHIDFLGLRGVFCEMWAGAEEIQRRTKR